MDLLCLACCQNTHCQCFIAHLMNFMQCPYCCANVDDIAQVLELLSIERSSLLEVARKDSPNEEVILKSPPDGILNTTPVVDTT